jgi:nucleoside-diphosphate-sugar epimerase
MNVKHGSLTTFHLLQLSERMKKVLITGIDGFTGLYLEGILAKAGYDVYGVVYPKSFRKTHLVCNITVLQEVVSVIKSVKPDYVIHLAGISFVPHSDVKQIYDINFFGSLNILDALLEAGVSPHKVVLASSSNVYGNPAVKVIDETICPAPISHYANSKLSMEFMARNFFDRLNILITRPFNYTGRGQGIHFLIPKIVAHFREGKNEIELGNLDVVRDFSDVRFVAEVYKKLLECRATSEIVNICSGKGVSLLEIIDRMNLMAGYKIKTVINPLFVRNNELKKLIGSNKKLLSLIGEQRTYAIEETLRWMFDAK